MILCCWIWVHWSNQNQFHHVPPHPPSLGPQLHAHGLGSQLHLAGRRRMLVITGILMVHTHIELEIISLKNLYSINCQLMIIIIILKHHLYVYINIIVYEKIPLQLPQYWFLAILSLAKAHCGFHADFQGELDIHLRASSMGCGEDVQSPTLDLGRCMGIL